MGLKGSGLCGARPVWGVAFCGGVACERRGLGAGPALRAGPCQDRGELESEGASGSGGVCGSGGVISGFGGFGRAAGIGVHRGNYGGVGWRELQGLCCAAAQLPPRARALVVRSPQQTQGEYPPLPPGDPRHPQGDGLELEYEMALSKGNSFRTGNFSADEFGAAAAVAVGKGSGRGTGVHRHRGVYWGLWGSAGSGGADGIGLHHSLGVYWELRWSGRLQRLGCIEMGT